MFDSFGIYDDVNKFLFEVNGVVGLLFKVCESYSEAHLYLKGNFVKESPPPPGGEKKRYFQGQYVGSRRAQCDRRSVKSERR
jgi:hypothetical protein